MQYTLNQLRNTACGVIHDLLALEAYQNTSTAWENKPIRVFWRYWMNLRLAGLGRAFHPTYSPIFSTVTLSNWTVPVPPNSPIRTIAVRAAMGTRISRFRKCHDSSSRNGPSLTVLPTS